MVKIVLTVIILALIGSTAGRWYHAWERYVDSLIVPNAPAKRQLTDSVERKYKIPRALHI